MISWGRKCQVRLRWSCEYTLNRDWRNKCCLMNRIACACAVGIVVVFLRRSRTSGRAVKSRNDSIVLLRKVVRWCPLRNGYQEILGQILSLTATLWNTIYNYKVFNSPCDFHHLTVLYRATIVQLLTQHVVRGDSWVPINGSPPC